MLLNPNASKLYPINRFLWLVEETQKKEIMGNQGWVDLAPQLSFLTIMTASRSFL